MSLKAEDVLKQMLALTENPQAIIEEATKEPLMDANGQLPAARKPSIPLKTAEKSSYATLKTLRARHYRIIALHIAGATNTAIAEEVNVTIHTVGKTLNSPLAQDLIAKAVGIQLDEAIGLKERLEEIADIGVARLEDIIVSDPDNKTALSAIKTVLEYVQSKAVVKTENTNLTVTAADIVAMRKRAAEIQPENLILEAGDYAVETILPDSQVRPEVHNNNPVQ